MTHQALARRYRPRRFSEVATQQHVSETLKRAVAGDRVGHAYLFCGPRGVGKTTLARVLAMALNCARRAADGEPCGECESCRRIWGGHTALDVVEIDAASNRGVDDARDLRERAMYAPSEEGRYKVYILDEAHMLTREAWNALLKVLEEPPPRVVFIFATTEPQRIQQSAAPVLSRCQRFDFRRIGLTDIVERLGEVLRQEGADAPEEALRIIARRAEGGMRDGLSLLDQVLALTGGEVSQDSVRRVLGLVEDERYLELLDILARHRHSEVFSFLESLLDEGYDLTEFYHGWVDVLRTLLRVRLGSPPPDLREDLEEAFARVAEEFAPGDLVRMLSLSSELESTGSLRRSGQPRLLLEMLFLRLSYLDRTVEIETLLRGLGGAPAPGSEAGRRPSAGSGGPGGRAREAHSREASPADRAAGLSAAPPVAGREGGELDAAWARVVEGGARSVLPGLGPFLRSASVREEPAGTVRLELPAGPARDRLDDPAARRGLADALSGALGRAVELVLEDVTPAHEGPRPERITAHAVREARLRDLLAREPLLGPAVKELDLELLE